MRESLPFHHEPDPVLGTALRRVLDPGDTNAFVARVLERAAALPQGSWDAVLARWARVGVAAAALVALAGGYLVGHAIAPTPAPRPSVVDALLSRSLQTPDAELVLASVIGN